jgi:anti-anti-sigma regulatory factor
MLKITRHTRAGSMHLTLEGRLIGPWVHELEQAWQCIKQSEGGSLVVDLTGVTFIEESGRDLLGRMWQEGAELIATGCCNRSIVEHITGSRPSSPVHQRSRK